jgi:hypothetical protein
MGIDKFRAQQARLAVAHRFVTNFMISAGPMVIFWYYIIPNFGLVLGERKTPAIQLVKYIPSFFKFPFVRFCEANAICS